MTQERRVKAVLGPTNTGKTHLAIERLCAHSSGAIGFPLRLLAREVYDRVRAMKGDNRVALITGEERIEPRDARWLLCTAEAMPVGQDLAFVALDEAQLAADRERGHVFTDRLLHARGREETLILGSSVLEPMVKALVPEAEIVTRPRFSTLSHGGAKKLSRVPPRSAIVAFSAEQVYALAEMLRRFRGGAAVVMGALSPETRNRQVELYQSGEVDYLVATDAIGMGLNLDVNHVAFAGLSKFDGQRQRRLTTAEMAQIAGRAGRHQRDGTFGTLAGTGGHDSAFTDDEIYAIEEHRFPPLTRLYWREAEPRFDSLAMLIADLECPPDRPELEKAPQAIDLGVLKRLAEEPAIAATLRFPRDIARFWEACSLPDFRQLGIENHARFVARLWEDLRRGHIGADYVATRISELDNPAGDIDTLQGRIAAIRSWAYIAQRPDWVLARDEMAGRARAAEARLSDALHARLTERFVNRRTTVLMKRIGKDTALMPVRMEGNRVLVEEEEIGALEGFRFRVDPDARHDDHRLLLAAAERHLPGLLAERAESLIAAIAAQEAPLALVSSDTETKIVWDRAALALLRPGKGVLQPQLQPDAALAALPEGKRDGLMAAVDGWLTARWQLLEPLRQLDRASREPNGGPELRALLIRLVEAGGLVDRAASGLDALGKEQRQKLVRLGVRIGALDLFLPALLKPPARRAWHELALIAGRRTPEPLADMPPVIPAAGGPAPGYRRLGTQQVRMDMAEKLLREVHEIRVSRPGKTFAIDPARAISMGLQPASHDLLLRQAGFVARTYAPLAEAVHGPPRPTLWRWMPARDKGERNRGERTRSGQAAPARAKGPENGAGNAFAALAGLFD